MEIWKRKNNYIFILCNQFYSLVYYNQNKYINLKYNEILSFDYDLPDRISQKTLFNLFIFLTTNFQ